MRYFLDTEFIEDGRTIEPLSIGLVAEDGTEFYAETELAAGIMYRGQTTYVTRDGRHRLVPIWVQENVVPHLRGGDFIRSPSDLRLALLEFIGESPEFWAYYADYDWVVLCQLFGTMMDLPSGWPMYCHDLRQALDDRGMIDVKAEPNEADGAEHDALADARSVARVWREHISAFAGTDV